MARVSLSMEVEPRDFEGLRRMMESICEALGNAHFNGDEIEFTSEPDGMCAMGTLIVTTSVHIQPDRAIVRFRPAAGMILFIGWLMAILPDRATVTWRKGWPVIYCPPYDDRNREDDPTPLVPNELVPA